MLEYRYEGRRWLFLFHEQNQFEIKHCRPCHRMASVGAALKAEALGFHLISEPSALIYQAGPHHSVLILVGIFCNLSLSLEDAGVCWFGG